MGFTQRFSLPKVESTPIVSEGSSFQSFNTPFQTLPNGNLSMPLIWDRYKTRGYIPFGEDNLAPNQWVQLYYQSPLHSAICDFKVSAAVGGGYEIDESGLSTTEKMRLYSVINSLNLAKLVEQIGDNKVIHERNYFIVKLKDGKCLSVKRCSSEKVRTNKEKTIYTISDDWIQGNKLETHAPFEWRMINEKTTGTFIMCYENDTLGQDIYPLPRYISALNFAFLSGELSHLAKSNIQNSIFPSFAMLFPKKPQNDEEKAEIRDTLGKLKGASNAGKGVAFFAQSKENLPELVNIPANQNDKLFIEASGLVTEQICFAHTIDPILLGVRTSGALGSGTDIKQAYIIFEKNTITPLRIYVEKVVNDLLQLHGFRRIFSIKNFQIIQDTIVEVEDEGSATVNALNSMSPLVATKVLETMTPNETRALAGLEPLPGGDTIAVPEQGATAGGTDFNKAATDIAVNDALKGLSAQDNMDMMRIVRDYNKGKLPLALAKSRLLAYGFDAETINEILGQ